MDTYRQLLHRNGKPVVVNMQVADNNILSRSFYDFIGVVSVIMAAVLPVTKRIINKWYLIVRNVTVVSTSTSLYDIVLTQLKFT